MKRNLRIILALAVAASTAACTKDIDNTTAEPGEDGVTVPVEISASAPGQGETGTRTSIDIDGNTFVTRWSDGDQMAVSYKNASEEGTVPFTYEKTSGKFKNSLTAYTGEWTYNAFIPYYASAPTHTSSEKTVFQTTFSNHRTQHGNSFNYLYDPLLATQITTTGAAAGKDDMGNDLNFEFQRLTSILKCKISGGSESQKIKAVLLTSPDETPVSSSLIRSNSSMETTPSINGVSPLSNVIAVTFDDGTAPSTANAEVYFNMLPATYSGLQIDVITEDGKIAGRKYTTPFNLAAEELTVLNFDNLTFRDVAKPSLVWPDQDINASHKITTTKDADNNTVLTYSAAIEINVPAGIAGLTVDITSQELNAMGITSLDLFNEEAILDAIPYKSELGLDCSTLVQYKKSTLFDITKLVPMIADLGAAMNSEHIFTVNVTDLTGRTTSQPIKFVIPNPTIAYEAGAWNDMANFKLNYVPASAKSVTVQYKTTDETQWHDATVNSTNTLATVTPDFGEFIPTPDWTTLEAANIKPYKRLRENTGIIAGKTYQYKLIVDGTEFTGSNFTAPTVENNALPTLNNTGLSCYTNDNKTAEWWGSGNNNYASSLCKPYAALNCALLKAASGGLVAFVGLAPGNLFTGTFNRPGTNGTVYFGRPYTWQARPKAVKIRYDAKIGVANNGKHGWKIAENQQDYARIFVAIVNWDKTRDVTSGTSSPTGCWDPETTTDPSADGYGGGEIVAYASCWIAQTELTGSLTETEIPFNWYKPEVNPSSAKYSIVISCSTSAYGDYLNGGKNNELYVGDFEWVY